MWPCSDLVCVLLCGILLTAEPRAQIPGIGPTGPVVKAFSGFTFTEGPAQNAAGDLYFTDVNTNTIHRVDTTNTISAFLTASQGANGIDFDRNGRMVVCLMDAGSVVSIDLATKAITTLAGQYQGVRFNSPNDITTDVFGGIWFTDPNFRGTYQDKQCVYYIDSKKVLSRVIDTLTRPNGIMLSPAEDVLYVASTTPAAVMAYPVLGPGKLGAGTVFFPLGTSTVDGMTVDSNGNLYLARPGLSAIEVVTPAAVSLGRIAIPEAPSNVTFGGPVHKTLYVTARTGLYKADMLSTGHVPMRMVASATTLKVGGGSVDLDVFSIPFFQQRPVLVVASGTGTEPGFLFGTTRVPIQVDELTGFVLGLTNTPAFSGFFGVLTAGGAMSSKLNLPALDTALIGYELHFAGIRAGPVDGATNAVGVRIVP